MVKIGILKVAKLATLLMLTEQDSKDDQRDVASSGIKLEDLGLKPKEKKPSSDEVVLNQEGKKSSISITIPNPR